MSSTSKLRRPERGAGDTYRRWIVCIVAAAAVILTGACSEKQDVADEATEAPADESSGLHSPGEDPAGFEGDPVTISAVVDEVVHPNAFFIKADDPNGDRYLIMHQEGVELAADDPVEITGRVEALDMFELEEELNVDLDMPTFERYEGDYGIIATNIELTA